MRTLAIHRDNRWPEGFSGAVCYAHQQAMAILVPSNDFSYIGADIKTRLSLSIAVRVAALMMARGELTLHSKLKMDFTIFATMLMAIKNSVVQVIKNKFDWHAHFHLIEVTQLCVTTDRFCVEVEPAWIIGYGQAVEKFSGYVSYDDSCAIAILCSN